MASDRDVEINISANDKTSKGFRSAAREAERFREKVEAEVEKAGRLGGDKLGQRVADGLGGKLQTIAGIAAGIGSKAGERLANNLSNSISGAGPQIQGAITAVIAGGIATAAPLIGATLAGAVIGGAGVGGVVGGIVIASRDPRIKTAATNLGTSIMETLDRQAQVFVGPLLNAIGLIQQKWTAISPLIQRALSASARYVEPLTRALLNAGQSILGGIVAALERGGPVIDATARGIEKIGKSVGDAIALFSTLGPEAASAFDFIFTVVAKTIDALAQFIYVLSKVWGWITTLGGLVGDDGAGMEQLSGDIRTVDAAARPAATALQGLAGATKEVSDATLYLDKVYGNSVEGRMALDAAEFAYKRTLEGVNDAKEKGGQISIAEREYLRGLAEQTAAYTAELSKNGVSGDALRAKQTELMNAFIASARQMGMNAEQARALAARYGLIPPEIKTNVKVTGVPAAVTNIRAVEQEANRVDGRVVDVAIRVTGSNASRQAIAAAVAKQSMMADAGMRAEHAAATFAARHGFAAGGGSLAGAYLRAGSRESAMELRQDLTVNLDGRLIAPAMMTISRRTTADSEWRRTVGKR